MAVSTRARNLFVISLVVSLVAAACGGGSTPEPATAGSSDSDERQASGDSSDDEKSSSSASDSDEAPAAKKKPACDDGTCTLCGDAQCPTGWYCDESAKGGPACGWLPECAKKPTCACVKKVFPGGCEERNGGLYVKQ
jgi:hypothetical protein